MSVYISLRRKDPSTPWGFKLQGGIDFNQPLTIANVTQNGLSHTHGLRPGDRIISIGGDYVNATWSHQQGQQAIIRCGNELTFEVTRGHPLPMPHVSKASLSLNMHREPARSTTPTFRKQPSSNFMSGTMKHIMAASNNDNYNHPSVFSPKETMPMNTYQPQETYKPPPMTFQPPAVAPKPNKDSTVNPNRKVARYEANCSSSDVPVCYECKENIRGPYIVALDFAFCPEHFSCCICKKNMKYDEFIEEDGFFYCEKDFAENKAEKCGACGQAIIGTIISALGKKWHNNCFTCHTCKCPIGNGIFHTGEDGNVFCEPHFKKAYEIVCEKCREAISEIDRYMEVFDKVYHAKCFACAACNVPLEGKPFHPRDGKAFCKAHAFASAIFS